MPTGKSIEQLAFCQISLKYMRLLYDQMHTYFDKLFVKHQRRFGKGYIAQHCILVMTGKMKEARDKK